MNESDKSKMASLSDLLNYEPDTYIKSDDITLIKNTFRGEVGNRLIKVLRKILLPSVGDPDMPIEEMGQDVWMVGRDYGAIPSEQVKSIVLARQEAIKFVMGGLIKLKVIASDKKETGLETALRQQKDSSK